ncbi:DUF6220 domain-containing protein [Agromyces sp. NPDC055520]
MRKLYFVVTLLLTASVATQLYLAAVGVFSNPDDELFALHGTNGRMILPILALLTIITAALARAGKRLIWLSVLPLVLILMQTVIFIVGGMIFGLGPDDHANPPIGATFFIALHGLNGAAILLISGWLAVRAKRLMGEPMPRRGASSSAEAPADATVPEVVR